MSSQEKQDIQCPPESSNDVSTCNSQFNDLDDNPAEVQCLLCEAKYTFPTNDLDMLDHLYREHQLIIDSVDEIASLRSYIRYWRMRFKEQPILSTFCKTIKIENPKTSDENTETTPEKIYYLLSDCLTEDKTLRDEIFRAKLEWVLAEQLRERKDTTIRNCEICGTGFSGTHIEYVQHLYKRHNIMLGKPENIVFIEEYVEKIESQFHKNTCIYCEKRFKNRIDLKEHMGKKLHMRVNPINRAYDKFFLINYTHEKLEHRRKRYSQARFDSSTVSCNNGVEDLSYWQDEAVHNLCLFCFKRTKHFSECLDHMETEHKFDFKDVTRKLPYYKKVKIVNYIRKQISSGKCAYCQLQSCSVDQLYLHMQYANHCKLPDENLWDQAEFYFSIYGGCDRFLYNLGDNTRMERVRWCCLYQKELPAPVEFYDV